MAREEDNLTVPEDIGQSPLEDRPLDNVVARVKLEVDKVSRPSENHGTRKRRGVAEQIG
jgi:hypothetical protein